MTSDSNRRPSKQKLAELVYRKILEKIHAGRYIEGDKLPSEAQLSETFEVSRSVIRDTLTQLQRNGFTRTHKGIGTFVSNPPLGESASCVGGKDASSYLRRLEPRIVLEVEAARLAALRRTRSQLEAIQSANDDLREQIGRGNLGREQDIRFHNCIAEAAGNENFLLLLQTIGNLTTQTITAGLELGRGQIRSRVIDEHTSIVDSIAIEDSEGAATFMRYHLYQARSALIGDYIRK